MTQAEEYAKLNAGRKVSFFTTLHHLLAFGYVAGYHSNPYSNETIVIKRDGGWKLTQFNSFTSVVLLEPGDTYWNIAIQHLTLLDDDIKPFAPPMLYTTTCSICHSPSRKINKHIACSNSKCKANKKLLALLPKKPLKTSNALFDAKNYLLCPICFALVNKANHPKGYSAPLSSEADTVFKRWLAVECINGHKFEHKWQDGEKIYWLDGTKYTSYIWSNDDPRRSWTKLMNECP